MGRLVQRIQRQAASGVGDGLLELALGAVAARQPLQGTRQLIAQALGLEELPIVEGGAIAQGEPRHEVVAA